MAHLSTVLLTDVAYLYTVSEHMPRLGYLTLLDVCVFGNISFVFAIFLQLTVLEIWEIDETQPMGPPGWTLQHVLLAAYLAGWIGSGIVLIIGCSICQRREWKKLGEPYSEEELSQREHTPITINMDFFTKKPMNCLRMKAEEDAS